MNSERAIDKFIMALDRQKARELTEKEKKAVDTIWKKLAEEEKKEKK